MIEVRPAREGDIEAIERIERECFSLPWSAQQLRAQLGEGYIFLAAEAEGEIAGYVGMQFVLDEGYISNVAVSESARRRGAGGALIAELLDRAQKLGLAFVTLEVRESNLPAIALYAKHGFAVEGRRKNYYEKPREDALIMTRRFENPQ